MIATALPVSGAEGLVVAPDPRAAEAGALMLRMGGNAFDAAVAAAFAIGVVEPFMSGIGGGAWLAGRTAAGGRISIEGPMVSPQAATNTMFQLGEGEKAGLYGWPSVVDDANIAGPLSVSVPGNVAALSAASKYGRLGLAACLQPAIGLARNGVKANWFMTSCIVSEMRRLRMDPGSLRQFLPEGVPLASQDPGPGGWLVQSALAATLQRIADNGVSELTSGATARSLSTFVENRGGILQLADFIDYRPVVTEQPEPAEFEGFRLFGPARTGVETVVQILRLVDTLRSAGRSAPKDPAAIWSAAMRMAFADRLEHMSADTRAGTDWGKLTSADYAEQLVSSGRDSDHSGGRSGCTSHITAVDRDGSVVSLTQTVLDLFGSRMLDPATGVLLNDGMMYFDPRPGAINEVRPSSPGLSAVSPVIVETNESVFALGASGGRRIISCVAQLVDAVARDGVSVQEAIDRPRLHCEGDLAVLDRRLSASAPALASAGLTVDLQSEEPTTWHFARPNGVARTSTNSWTAGADPYKPFGMVAVGPGEPGLDQV